MMGESLAAEPLEELERDGASGGARTGMVGADVAWGAGVLPRAGLATKSSHSSTA